MIVGGVFVLEALSVVIQVGSFKADRPARLPDGAAAPSLRADRLERAEGDHAVRDRRDHLRAVQPDDVEAAMTADDRSPSTGKRVTVVGRGAKRHRRRRAARRAAARASRCPTSRDRDRGRGRAARARRRSSSSAATGRDASRAPISSCSARACRRSSRRSQAARARGVPVIGEIELASRWLRGRVDRDHRHEGEVDDDDADRPDARGGRLQGDRSAATSARR